VAGEVGKRGGLATRKGEMLGQTRGSGGALGRRVRGTSGHPLVGANVTGESEGSRGEATAEYRTRETPTHGLRRTLGAPRWWPTISDLRLREEHGYGVGWSPTISTHPVPGVFPAPPPPVWPGAGTRRALRGGRVRSRGAYHTLHPPAGHTPPPSLPSGRGGSAAS